MDNRAPNHSARKQPQRNEVHIHGLLARSPEIRYTPTGKAVASFTVVTTFEKRTEYHRCVASEEHAEKLGEHFHEADYIRICGRLQTRSWDDQQTGQKRYTTEVIAWNLSDRNTEKNAHGVEVGNLDIAF